jgi:hypothetical protein
MRIYRLVMALAVQICLLGCTPPPLPTTVSPPPSITPSLLPVPTPAPLGTTQTIRLKNTTLAITPIEVKSHVVSSTQILRKERLYVAIKFQFDALGPDVWRPSNSYREEGGGICIDLQVATDISRPLCNVLYSSPSLRFTSGGNWPCDLVLGNDPLRWYQKPELSLQPLLPGDSRVGWVTWCISEDFGGADTSAFRDGLILETYGSIYGFWAEWSIHLGQ